MNACPQPGILFKNQSTTHQINDLCRPVALVAIPGSLPCQTRARIKKVGALTCYSILHTTIGQFLGTLGALPLGWEFLLPTRQLPGSGFLHRGLRHTFRDPLKATMISASLRETTTSGGCQLHLAKTTRVLLLMMVGSWTSMVDACCCGAYTLQGCAVCRPLQKLRLAFSSFKPTHKIPSDTWLSLSPWLRMWDEGLVSQPEPGRERARSRVSETQTHAQRLIN